MALDALDSPGAAQSISVDGIDLGYRTAGPESGAPVILLHGFPEFSFGWRRQIPALADAGFRVFAIDQRGYNRSSKPQRIAAYDLDRLVDDVAGFARQLDLGRFAVVGHDWGASVAWWLASTRPEKLSKVAVLNAPHPALWKDAMRHNPAQRRKSWYVHVLALPWLPEVMMRAGGYNALRQSLVDSSRPGTFSDVELAIYREAWAQPGALTAMIHWYRALLRKEFHATTAAIDVDTLMIWGVEDKFGERSVAEESIRLCRHGQAVYIDDATHWVQHERPERVNELLISFLRS